MRYLIFGDVHGNLPALEKLFKIEKDNYDLAVSHGDVVNYGPWSNECVDFLANMPALIKLMGNHEENFISGDYSGTNEVALSFFNFCYPKFKKGEKISTYSQFYKIKDYTIQHTIGNHYIFPDSDLESFPLTGNFVIGHSHHQFDRSFEGKRLINTGSIGQNRKFLNQAEYVILDDETGNVELKNFRYNIDLVINQMLSDSYPEICIEYYKNKPRKI